MKILNPIIILLPSLLFFNCYGSVSLDKDLDIQSLKHISEKPDIKWEQKFSEPFQDVFQINDSLVLVFTHRSTAFIFNVFSGKKDGSKWHPNLRKFSTINLDNDGIFFAFTSRKGERAGLYDLALGELRWKQKAERLIEGGLAIVNDTLVAIATRNKLKFLSIDTGEILSEKRVRQGIISLQQVGDHLFIIQDNGILKAFNVDKSLWEIDLGLNHESIISLADEDKLMVTKKESLYILNNHSGKKVNEIEWEPLAYVFSLPDKEKIILISKTGKMGNFSIPTGEQIDISSINQGLIKYEPTISGDHCIMPFANGYLKSVSLENGIINWEIETGKALTGFWRTGKGFLTQDTKKILRYYQ